jgi:hypothetical protein
VQCNSVQCSAVQCSAVQCSALHCTALHCTMSLLYYDCTALHCTAHTAPQPHSPGSNHSKQFRPTVRMHSALVVSALHCTALHCTALHCTEVHCTALHCTALHCGFNIDIDIDIGIDLLVTECKLHRVVSGRYVQHSSSMYILLLHCAVHCGLDQP